jgi:hypothetical protein
MVVAVGQLVARLARASIRQLLGSGGREYIVNLLLRREVTPDSLARVDDRLSWAANPCGPARPV